MYFAMREDRRIKNRIQFKDIKVRTYIGFEAEEIEKINDISVMFVEGGPESIYPDFMEAPFYLISDRMKLLIELYDLTVQYKKVVLIHKSQNRQSIYWLILPKQRACLHESTEFFPNGWVKKTVLDRRMLNENRIFQVNMLPVPQLVLQLDVTEAILRRNMTGVEFECITSEEE